MTIQPGDGETPGGFLRKTELVAISKPDAARRRFQMFAVPVNFRPQPPKNHQLISFTARKYKDPNPLPPGFGFGSFLFGLVV